MSAPETYFDTPVTRAQVASGAWVRPEHAASALGCDERTIRRRVRSGAFVRAELGGRVYVRQAPVEPLGPKAAKASVEREQSATAALALVVREQANRLEQLAHELAIARVAAAHLEHTADTAGRELGEARAAVTHLEHELGTVRQLARAIGEQAQREQARATATEEQLAQARAQVEHERQRTAAFVAQVEAERAAEQARAARLERLAQAPWYAVRERKRLRRELESGAA